MTSLGLAFPNFPDHDCGAWLSPCRRYRYQLWRRWDAGPFVTWIALNPSTADESSEDPTSRRFGHFARQLGAGGYIAVNAYAYRATHPGTLREVADPVGPENDKAILSACEGSWFVIAAWGDGATHLGRDQAVLDLLAAHDVRVWCLGTTKGGRPRHPGRLAYSTKLEVFRRAH